MTDTSDRLAEVDRLRAENARPAAQEPVSGPETPQGHPSEGTSVSGPHARSETHIDTIARILVGTDWDEEVPYTDIGPRETVAHLAGQIATVLAPGPAPITLAQAATALHGWARDLDDGARTDWPAGHPDIIRGIRAAADWLDAIRGIRAAADLLDNAARDLTEGTTNG